MTELQSISSLDEPMRSLGLALHAQIERLAPHLKNSVKWGQLVYAGHKSILSLAGFGKGDKAYIKLQLFRGAEIDNPQGLIVGTGAFMRHIIFNEMSDISRQGVDEAILAMVALDEAPV